jgi:hypothetical protein
MGITGHVHRTPTQEPTHCRIINRTRDRPQAIRFMKRQIAKPSDEIMRFFTPELYRRFNAPEGLEETHEAWEKALKDYEQHLRAIRPHMPQSVKQLSKLCLHDAEVLAVLAPFENTATVLLKQENTLYCLLYRLVGQVREHGSADDWPYSKQRKHWLYDELDAEPAGRKEYRHRILFSDGSVLELPFASVSIHRIPMDANGELQGLSTASPRRLSR